MRTVARVVLPVLLLLAAILGAGIFFGIVGVTRPAQPPHEPSATGMAPLPAPVRLDAAGRLVVPPEVVSRLGIATAKAVPAQHHQPLELQGSLALDPNHLVRVHSRFPGEVKELPATIPDANIQGGQTRLHPANFGDEVHEGDLLAIVWCKDLGEKKSELVDALSQLHLDQEQLQRYQDLYQKGALPEANLLQTQRSVEADLNAAARAERTLRVWQLSDTEIQAVKNEAERIRKNRDKQPKDKITDWARVEVRAPSDGVIVEKNVSVGDIIDTTTDLFKIARLDTLTVWAHAYEENLPALEALTPEQRYWTVRVPAHPDIPPMRGRIEKIGYVVDPTQHTVLVMGHVDNSRQLLRAGQFITASVDLPPPAHQVSIPASAVDEEGDASYVFVQPKHGEDIFVRRKVALSWRGQDTVDVRSELSPSQSTDGLQPLHAGEWVVTNGTLELNARLDDLKPPTPPAPK